MKAVCGFKGLDGQFYEKEKDCKVADLEYRIAATKRCLNNFGSHLDTLFIQAGFLDAKELAVLDIVSKAVLRDSDMFLKIIADKKLLEKDLDELLKEHQGFLKPWWLKVIWWK